MPDAIANLAPPPAPRKPQKAPAKPQSEPAKRDFDEELQRACAPDEDPKALSETPEGEAEPVEERPDHRVKAVKATQAPVSGVPDIAATNQPQVPLPADQAVIDAASEASSAESKLPPFTADVAIDQLPETVHIDPDELPLPEELAGIDALVTTQLPPSLPDTVAIATPRPPGADEAPDASAFIQATPRLAPTPSPERGQESLSGDADVEPDQETLSATPNQVALPPVTESAASALPDEDQPATPVETIEDPSAQLTGPTQTRETPAAKPLDLSPTRSDTPEPRFVDDNHPKIITALRTDLFRNGGSVTIRLDPPGLGEVQVSVELRDGAMIASIQTSSDDATRLMSHSLGQLKRSLESSGLAVEKLQVQQAPRDEQGGRGGGGDRPGQQHHGDGRSAQQEQQRREILERVWRRLRGGRDPIDFVV